jgi:hypothetical protein
MLSRVAFRVSAVAGRQLQQQSVIVAHRSRAGVLATARSHATTSASVAEPTVFDSAKKRFIQAPFVSGEGGIVLLDVSARSFVFLVWLAV